MYFKLPKEEKNQLNHTEKTLKEALEDERYNWRTLEGITKSVNVLPTPIEPVVPKKNESKVKIKRVRVERIDKCIVVEV